MGTSWAQACITNVSFPGTLDGLRGMVQKNAGVRAAWELDFDVLASYDPSTGYEWTTGPWLRAGDFIFFYHAKGAAARIAELSASAGRRGSLACTLRRAAEFSEEYAGTIFAYGKMSAHAERGGQYAEGNHFKTQACAPCEYVKMLRVPLAEEVWSSFLQIKRRGAVTPLMSRPARRLRDCAVGTGVRDDELREARFGDPAVGRVGKKSWRRAAGAASRFGHEHQVREYVADYLLAELADKWTPILQECRCYRAGRSVGQVDYFLRISGAWLPAEVKLDAGNVPAALLRGQLVRYVGVEICKPVLGAYCGRAHTVGGGDVGLVIDRHGVYVTKKGRFVGCAPGRPRWLVVNFDGAAVGNVRAVVVELSQNSSTE